MSEDQSKNFSKTKTSLFIPVRTYLLTDEGNIKLEFCCYLLVAVGLAGRKAVLVHDPAAPEPLGRLPDIEHQRLLEPDRSLHLNVHRAVGPRGLPVAGRRDSVGAVAIAVLAVSRNVEVPLLVPNRSQSCGGLCRA